MKSRHEIKRLFAQLPMTSQRELLNELLQEQELQGKILIEAQKELSGKRKKKPCPHCAGSNVYKRGKQQGVQMYQCNDCKRWYSETTGTPLYDIKLKSKWQSYLRCMEQGMPIKKIAKEIGISIQTSFDWRHKNDFKRNMGKEELTVVQVVTAVERKGEKYLKVVASKRLSKKEIAKVLYGKLAGGTTLITDKHPSFKAFAKDNPDIKHKALLAKDHVDRNDKTIHLQKVNSVHAELRMFLRPFNGVSSKYLQNYLNWYAYADKIRESKTTLKQWFLTMLLTDQAYHLFELFKENAVIIRT